MDSLGANGAVPETSESTRTCGCGLLSAGIGLSWAEERPEGAEDAGARAERHGCSLCSLADLRGE